MKSYLTLVAAVVTLAQTAFAIDPSDILKKADDVRNPGGSFQMKVAVENDGDVTVFDVMTKGKDKTLIKTIAPARDRGRNLLMLEDNMWAYIPNLKRAVRVSLNQKLTGQAANGDISRMRWADDYTATIESENAKEWVLFLTANRKGLTYDKIRAHVEKNTFRPIKAQYLQLNGDPLKLATFSGYKQIAGAVRPTRITIADHIKESNKSTIVIKSMEVADFPASIFNQNSLK